MLSVLPSKPILELESGSRMPRSTKDSSATPSMKESNILPIVSQFPSQSSSATSP